MTKSEVPKRSKFPGGSKSVQTNNIELTGFKLSKQVEYKEMFEPYILANRSTIPRYNERFVGRVRDKISHLYEVHKAG